MAASYGHPRSLKVLLDLGANIFVTDKTERTALHLACQENNPDVVRALLDHSGGKNLLDEDDRYGYQPLHIAAQEGYVECVRVGIYPSALPLCL